MDVPANLDRRADGDWDCQLHVAGLADQVGNERPSVLLEGRLQVDISPADPIDTPGLKHLRIPWGAEQTRGSPGHYLVAADLEVGQDPTGDGVALPDGLLSEETPVALVYESREGGAALAVLRPGGLWRPISHLLANPLAL